jgi:hypothetical protein
MPKPFRNKLEDSKGHGFSRANKQPKWIGASAPEGMRTMPIATAPTCEDL